MNHQTFRTLLSICVLIISGAAFADVRIMLVGDSTQTERQGYGTGFCANLTAEVTCMNKAKGGASTKTYRREGLWDGAVGAKPDWMLIQFGHNDVPSKDHSERQTDPVTEYPANLRQFIAEARAAGIRPVLVTPFARRYFQADGKILDDLDGHSATVREVAKELNVPLIDLHELSKAYFEKLGETESHKLGATKQDGSGGIVPDKTHLIRSGSFVIGRMVTEAMARSVPELAKYVRETPATP